MPQKGVSKIGRSEKVKCNVIRLVRALLTLAEELSEPEGSHPNQAVQAKWVSLKKLRVTGRRQKGKAGSKKIIEGTRLPDLVQLVEASGDSIEPVKSKKKSGDSKDKEHRQVAAVRNVIQRLEELKVLEEDSNTTSKSQGYRQFTLALKSDSATLQENLEWVKQKWNEHKQQDSSFQATSKSAIEEGINWHHVCRERLKDQQKKQTFRQPITGRESGHEVNVYVPLGLVKPKEQPWDSQPSAERGMQQYELTKKEIEQEFKYKCDEFLKQVIEGKVQGRGDAESGGRPDNIPTGIETPPEGKPLNRRFSGGKRPLDAPRPRVFFDDKIYKDNLLTVTTILSELISNYKDTYFINRVLGLYSISNKHNSLIVPDLIKIIQEIRDFKDEELEFLLVTILLVLEPENSIAIETLIQLMNNSCHAEIHWGAAGILIKNNNHKQTVVMTLIKIIETSQIKNTVSQALQMLGEINEYNKIAINFLVKFIHSCQSQDNRKTAVESLIKIDPGNSTAIDALVDMIQSSQPKSYHFGSHGKPVDILKTILEEPQMAGIVTALKDYLSDETYKNDYRRYLDCYEVIWHCAQTLPYPDFYKAWHQADNSPEIQVSV